MPDHNLGRYIASKLPQKRFVFHSGYCPVHDAVRAFHVDEARAAHPGAPVLVHPECRMEVIEKADFVGSTAQILDYVAKSDKAEFIIGTESGIIHRLSGMNEGKRFYQLKQGFICPNMKKMTLEKLLISLENHGIRDAFGRGYH